MTRIVSAILLLLAALPVLSLSAAPASAEDRSLKLYFIHTGEKAVITFKRNGRYDPRGLEQINQFLRDWRKDQPTKMDPRLFDLVWEVYRRSGASDYIHVVSAFRSPETNNMLRTRTRYTGVAKNSQHMLGKAMDFYIPGVKLSTLRAIGMQMQVGGVGFYPTSGSPFVHMDVGSVRAWPRMSREELVQIFPKGNTLHLPADGKPLPGYDQALADYKRRVGPDSIQIASTAGGPLPAAAERKRPGLLAMLFGGGGADEEEDNEESQAPATMAQRPGEGESIQRAKPAAPSVPREQPAAVAPAQPTLVASAEPAQPAIAAPVPLSRPAFRSDNGGAGGLATALYSTARNPAQEALVWQTSAPAAAAPAGENFADLSNYSIPVPTLLGPRGYKGDAGQGGGVMTASLAPTAQAPEEAGNVPLPTHRPGNVDMASIAPAVDAQSGSPIDEEQQKALTPAVIAALAHSASYARSVAAPVPTRPEPAAPVVAAAPAPASKPMQVAAISPKVIQPSGKSMQFGDGFDAPKPATASMGALPTRGGRNTAATDGTTHSAPLTGDMLAKWATTNSRTDAAASMKAPRVVSRTINGEYSAAYASNGFKPVSATVVIDNGRFGNSTP